MIVEIRDFRNRSPIGKPTIQRVVLRPDTESIINDIQQLSSKSMKRWTADDFIIAEERILVHKIQLLIFICFSKPIFLVFALILLLKSPILLIWFISID